MHFVRFTTQFEFFIIILREHSVSNEIVFLVMSSAVWIIYGTLESKILISIILKLLKILKIWKNWKEFLSDSGSGSGSGSDSDSDSDSDSVSESDLFIGDLPWKLGHARAPQADVGVIRGDRASPPWLH